MVFYDKRQQNPNPVSSLIRQCLVFSNNMIVGVLEGSEYGTLNYDSLDVSKNVRTIHTCVIKLSTKWRTVLFCTWLMTKSEAN